MAKAQEALSVAVMKKIDAACDRFEADWKAGKKPSIEKHLGAATGSERAELLRMLLKLELELNAGRKASQTSYESRFPDDAAIVQSVFRDLSERTTSQRAAASADTSVGKDSVSSQETAAHVPESTPTRIGRFEVIEILGQGAFGRVYKARDPQLDRHVAIKVPLQSALGSQEEIDRFLSEARAAATLHHPNLCPVHEVGQDESGAYYIVMAFVAGKTLSAFLKERKEPVAARQAALIVRKLALALGAAHAKGIVHRDLKPSNVMIEKERKDVVIMDFGLARRRKNGDASQTREGVVMGTPAYMSPEQARGDVKAIGPASDIYGLGVILYEMLACKVPFSGSVNEVLGKVLHVDPEPPSALRDGVDPQLEAICMKAIAKEPAGRYPSMKALADALDGFLKGVPGESITAKPQPKAKASDSSAGLTQVVEAMSAERKKERTALEKTVGKQSRLILAAVLAAFGVLGCLMVGGIIMFFFRTPTTIVQVTLNTKIDPRLIEDKSIAFYLNDKLLSKEELETPIKLTKGRHILQGRRDGSVVYEVILEVGGEGNRATIDVIPSKEFVPAPKKVDPPTPTPAEWIPLFNGKDLTGWNVLHEDGAPVESAKNPWKARDGEIVFSLPEGTIERFNLTSDREFADFRLRFEFQADDKIRAAVRIRSLREGKEKGQGGGMVWIGDTFPFLKTGYFMYAPLSKQHLLPDPQPQLRPAGEWNVMEIDAQGQRQLVFFNGVKILDFDREELSKRPMATQGLTRPSGVLRFLGSAGTIRLRSLAVREYKSTPPPTDREAANQVLTLGGTVRILAGGNELDINAAGQLPGGPFQVVAIRLDGKKSVDDQVLARFRGLAKLRELRVTYDPITNEGLKHVKDLTELELLAIGFTRVTDAGLEHLKNLKALRGIALDNDDVGDEALRHLSNVPTLQSIWIQNTKVSDAGLQHLKKLTNLKELRVENTSVTPAGVKALKDALPGCQILASLPKEGAEWIPLFNGKDLAGWEIDGKDNAWTIKNGAIATVPDVRHRGWLFTKKDYDDFDFRFEFAVATNANSGIALRADPSEGSGKFQLEVQVRDEGFAPNEHITGSIIPTGIDSFAPPKIPKQRPLGEWNEMRILARGSIVRIEVNGTLAQEIDLAKIDPAGLKGDKEWGTKNLRRTRGRIGLQYSGLEIMFRNLRVKELR